MEKTKTTATGGGFRKIEEKPETMHFVKNITKEDEKLLLVSERKFKLLKSVPHLV